MRYCKWRKITGSYAYTVYVCFAPGRGGDGLVVRTVGAVALIKTGETFVREKERKENAAN